MPVLSTEAAGPGMERAAAYPWQSPTTTVMPGYYTTTTTVRPEKYCPVLQCPECPAPYCPPMCDSAGWPECQCLNNPNEMFTPDGRGNCNAGASLPDLQVWCFVDPYTSVCPDTRQSTVTPG